MKFRIILAIIFISQISNAQINTHKYLGTIILENNIPMSFSLDLIEKNGIVSGYSLTNHGTKDETKSEIQGVYFKEDKSFQLQETQIIYTKSEAPINSFCYIRMNLKQKNRFTKKQLEGNFTGNFLDSNECAKGKILLAEKSIIEKKIKKIEKKIEKKLEKEEIIETKVLKDGDNLNINWKAKYLTIKIWDSNQEDGDKINLEINSDVILDNYETKKNKAKGKKKSSSNKNRKIRL